MKKKIMKQKKEDERYFKCDKCPKKYTSFLALEKHTIDKHPEPPVCKYAWKVSSSFLVFWWPDVNRNSIIGLVRQILDLTQDPKFEGDITIRRIRTGDC